MKQPSLTQPPAYDAVRTYENDNARPTYFDIVGRLKQAKLESNSLCGYLANSLRILYGSCK